MQRFSFQKIEQQAVLTNFFYPIPHIFSQTLFLHIVSRHCLQTSSLETPSITCYCRPFIPHYPITIVSRHCLQTAHLSFQSLLLQIIYPTFSKTLFLDIVSRQPIYHSRTCYCKSFILHFHKHCFQTLSLDHSIICYCRSFIPYFYKHCLQTLSLDSQSIIQNLLLQIIYPIFS